MILSVMRTRLRSYLDDTESARYKWDDSELNDAINDALQDAFVRARMTIQDSISLPFTQTLGVWNSKYALSPSYLEVLSVRLNSTPEKPLLRTSISYEERVNGVRPVAETGVYAFALDQTTVNSTTGLPERSITFIGVPSEADTAILDVSRLPATLTTDNQIPEIDPMWHSDLLWGAAFYAYNKKDTDTFDPDGIARYYALFEARFGEKLPAVVIRERQTDVPMEMIVC
jgi:hypothetical protein